MVKRRQKEIIIDFLALKERRYGRLTPEVYSRQQELFRLMKAANRRGRVLN